MKTGMEKLDVLYSQIPEPGIRYSYNSLKNISAGNKGIPYIIAKNYEYQIKHTSLRDGLLVNSGALPFESYDELEAVAKFLDTYAIRKVYVMESLDSSILNFNIIQWFADNYKDITVKPVKDKWQVLMEISW